MKKYQNIGITTVSNLKGWTSGSENNKTYADFIWAPPANIAIGNYLFYAEIDPENKIKEVHEEWSDKIPGGNNTGYFMFPVRDPLKVMFQFL